MNYRLKSDLNLYVLPYLYQTKFIYLEYDSPPSPMLDYFNICVEYFDGRNSRHRWNAHQPVTPELVKEILEYLRIRKKSSSILYKLKNVKKIL